MTTRHPAASNTPPVVISHLPTAAALLSCGIPPESADEQFGRLIVTFTDARAHGAAASYADGTLTVPASRFMAMIDVLRDVAKGRLTCDRFIATCQQAVR